MKKYPIFYGTYWTPDPILEKINMSGYGLWFRIKGYGLHFTNRDLSFSERNGYVKYYKLPFGLRMKFLKP